MTESANITVKIPTLPKNIRVDRSQSEKAESVGVIPTVSPTVPAAENGRKCQRCSLKELCMPKTALSAKAYCQALAREAQEVDATCENC